VSTSWIAVACAEHVRIGRARGFMQVCHGKAAPLRRLSPGDRVVYYSPTEKFGGKDRLQAFTAIGVVAPGAPYQADIGSGVCAFRRDVLWSEAVETPVRPLLGCLSFAQDNRNWGYQLRFGLFKVEDEDMRIIASAMGAMLALSHVGEATR
jgi:EVE domain